MMPLAASSTPLLPEQIASVNNVHRIHYLIEPKHGFDHQLCEMQREFE
jgi:hypothetical protein